MTAKSFKPIQVVFDFLQRHTKLDGGLNRFLSFDGRSGMFKHQFGDLMGHARDADSGKKQNAGCASPQKFIFNSVRTIALNPNFNSPSRISQGDFRRVFASWIKVRRQK
jgi:hypothetical protein